MCLHVEGRLHVKGQMVSMTKICEGYTWRLLRKHDQKAYKLHVECHKNSNLKIIEISSTSWCGAVDWD